MKKIIDGKRFDTETADLVQEWDNGCYGRDFCRCEESLYKTKKGVYFLAGSGGPLSKYAIHYENNEKSGSSDIEPISEDEALKWLEDHDGVDAIEEHFKDKIKDA